MWARITMFVALNGAGLLLGQCLVLLLPDGDIGRPIVVLLCAWNFILGRLVDQSLRAVNV